MLSEAVFVVFLSGAVNGALCFALYKQLTKEFRQLRREILSPAPATPMSTTPDTASVASIPPIIPGPIIPGAGLAPPPITSDHSKPAIDFRVLDRSQPFYFGGGGVSLPVVSPLTRDIGQRPLLAVDSEVEESVLNAVEKELGCTFEGPDTAGDEVEKASQAEGDNSSGHEDSPVDCASSSDHQPPGEQVRKMSTNGQTSAFAHVGGWLWARDRNASLGEKEFTDKNP